jgi:hypothetical protein
MERKGNAASCRDALQHAERMSDIFGILKAGDRGLRGADFSREFRLGEACALSHFTKKHGEVDLLESALECLPIRDALFCALLDDFGVSVVVHGWFHRPSSLRMDSRSFCDPV